MATFKDLNGKEWSVSLDGPKIREVRASTCTLGLSCDKHGPRNGEPKYPCDGLDLGAMDGSASQRMQADELLLHDALWALCESQAREKGIEAAAFYASICGDATERAWDALELAITDFFPSRKRTLLASLLKKQHDLTDKGMALAMAKLNDPTLSEKLLAKMTAEIDAKLLKLTQPNSVSSGPESSESVPAA